MHVYDVEVLAVKLVNAEIEKAIVDSQKDVIKTNLKLASDRRVLLSTIESEEIKRRTSAAFAETKTATMSLEAEVGKKKLELDLFLIESSAKAETERLLTALARENKTSEVESVSRARRLEDATAQAEVDKLAQVARIELINAEVTALVERMKSISPDLVQALQGFSDKALVEKITTAIAPMTLIGGGTVVEIVGKVFANTSLSAALKALAPAANGGLSPRSTT